MSERPPTPEQIERLKAGLCEACERPQFCGLRWCREHAAEALARDLPGMLKDVIEEMDTPAPPATGAEPPTAHRPQR